MHANSTVSLPTASSIHQRQCIAMKRGLMPLELWVDMIIICVERNLHTPYAAPHCQAVYSKNLYNSFILRSIKTSLIDVFKENISKFWIVLFECRNWDFL